MLLTYYMFKGEEKEALLPAPPEEQPREGTLISAGSGWSVKDEEEAAVEEAVSSARAQLKGKSPDFVILFSTVGYDSDKVLTGVRSLLGDSLLDLPNP